MKRVLFTGHLSFENRGCEAIVRSTCSLLSRQFGPLEFLVPSTNIEGDTLHWPSAAESGVKFVPPIKMPILTRAWARATSAVPSAAAIWPKAHLPISDREMVESSDLMLSIGGDNYSMDYGLGSLAFISGLSSFALSMGKPVVLWGASVGPFSANAHVEKAMASHLRELSLITVREEASANYLQHLKAADKMVRVADPAFAMTPEAFDLKTCVPTLGGPLLGLNISPLLARFSSVGTNRESLVKMTAEFVRRVIAESQLSVLLVPHVMSRAGLPENCDYIFLEEVYLQLSEYRARVGLLPRTVNAAQIKFAISKCELFVGARTHSIIGALSMGIPAVAIAYSVKARGINADFFEDDRYLVEARELSSSTLFDAVSRVRLNRDEIAAHLKNVVSRKIHLDVEKGVRSLSGFFGGTDTSTARSASIR